MILEQQLSTSVDVRDGHPFCGIGSLPLLQRLDVGDLLRQLLPNREGDEGERWHDIGSRPQRGEVSSRSATS